MVLIFDQPYNVCPRYPNGTRWEVYARGRYFSCCWNMESFGAALNYLRDQYATAVKDTRAMRRAGDEYCEQEFRGWIDGPGGRLDWQTIAALVKR
jgi:hypothetical protein